MSAPSPEKLDRRIRQVLEHCYKDNIVVSLKKFQLGKKVKLAGHVVSSEGVSPDPERLKAIAAEARALRSSVRALKGHLTRRILSAIEET